MDPYDSLERARSRRESDRENQARNAFAWGFERTTGWGEFRFPDVVDFELTFIHEPAVVYGCALDDDVLVDGRFPRCHGGVYRWRKDAKGMYVGAWVYATVETMSMQAPSAEPEPNYTINHSYQFSGTAYKAFTDWVGPGF